MYFFYPLVLVLFNGKQYEKKRRHKQMFDGDTGELLSAVNDAPLKVVSRVATTFVRSRAITAFEDYFKPLTNFNFLLTFFLSLIT